MKQGEENKDSQNYGLKYWLLRFKKATSCREEVWWEAELKLHAF